jgi:hypothetical protein
MTQSFAGMRQMVAEGATVGGLAAIACSIVSPPPAEVVEKAGLPVVMIADPT